MSEGFAEVEEGRLWYERAGDGFPVVIVHSGLMDARAWEMQFEAFAGEHEVVRYDRRGFGRSDAPTGPFSDLRDLRDLLSALGIARCALVGCAEGAALAIDLALEVPDAIEAVVSASPRVSGYRWRDPGSDVLADQVERTIRAGDAEGAIELQLAVWAPVTSKADPGVRKVAYENAASGSIPRRASRHLRRSTGSATSAPPRCSWSARRTSPRSARSRTWSPRRSRGRASTSSPARTSW